MNTEIAMDTWSSFSNQTLLLLIDIALKGGLILLLAVLASRWLRRISSSSRHRFWCLTLTGLLAISLLTPLLPSLPLPSVLPDSALQTNEPAAKEKTVAQRVSAAKDASPQDPEKSGAAGLATEPTALSPRQDASSSAAGLRGGRPAWLVALCLGLWLLGLLFVLARLGIEMLAMWRLGRKNPGSDHPELTPLLEELRVRLNIKRRIRLILDGGEEIPKTWGWLRPVIVLPAGCLSWSPEMRRHVLLHELFHIKRWDYLSQLAAHLACALHWFNPFCWRAVLKMKLERERACDDQVLSMVKRASSYAETLLKISCCRRENRLLASAPAIAEQGELETRIKAILDPRMRRAGSGIGKTTFLWANVLAASLLLAAFKPLAPAKPAPLAAKPAFFPVHRTALPRNMARPAPPVRNDEPLEALLASLASEDPTTRARAACELGKARLAVAVAKLIDLLGDETPIDAVGCYSRDDYRDWRPRYLSLKQESPGESAALALASIGAAAHDPLIAALAHPSSIVRRNAVWALAEARGKPPIASLQPRLGVLLEDADPWLRQAVLYALGEGRVHAAESLMIEALRDEAAHVRVEAAHSLGELRSTSADEPLIRALQDGDDDVRVMAVRALAEIRSRKAVPRLAHLLRDDAEDIRVRAAWALGEIRDSEGVQPLIRALADHAARVRETAAWALGEIRSNLALQSLMKAMGDKDPEVRGSALRALGEIGSDQALPALIDILAGGEPPLMGKAAWALAEIGSPRAVEPLIEALAHPSLEVRISAAWALGEIAHPSAEGALKQALEGAHDQKMIQTLKRALSEIWGR